MTYDDIAIIKRASEAHNGPGTLAVALAAFDALPPHQQKKARAIYRGLLAEPTLPIQRGAVRENLVPKKPVYRHNSETVKRAAMARRKLEEMHDDHD